MSPVENKEHKPGPIGKERSLKNRKVKDAQQVEPEGQEKPSPTVVRSADPVTKETKAASEMSAEIGTMISASSAEYGADVKVSVMQRSLVQVAQTVSKTAAIALPEACNSVHSMGSYFYRDYISCAYDLMQFLTVNFFLSKLLLILDHSVV